MDARGALARKAVAAVDEPEQRPSAGGDAHLRTDGAAVRFRPRQDELTPVADWGKHVVVEKRLAVRVRDEKVDPAVVVEVGDRHAAAVTNRIDAVLRRLIRERLAALVVVQA